MQRKLKTHSLGKTTAAALQRAVHQMLGLGQSFWDPHSLMIGGKSRGKLSGSDCGGVWRSGAEVSYIRRRSPWVNLRWSLRVFAWNVLSRRDDNNLSLLSSELKRLNIGIAALSEVWRQDSDKIMAGGYTYYWCGCSDGYHAQGVAVAVSNKLIPLIIEVTPVNERIMR